jgi:glycosyl transferase family 2
VNDAAMKVCAITMVYRDHWALAQWYMHYGRMLGPENLYVVSHGQDDAVHTICPKASVITIPRDDLEHFDVERSHLLNSLQNALERPYDWVIRTDVDELICLNPSIYPTLADLLAGQTASALFSLGMNVVEVPGDPTLTNGSAALKSRANVEFSGHYSKAWIRRRGVSLMRHGVKVSPRRAARFPFVMPRGVYLAHLKHANIQELGLSNQHRIAIARTRNTPGLPGSGWRDAEAKASRFQTEFAAKPTLDWATAEAQAYAELQKPKRSVSDGLVRAQSIRFDFRTQLPAWFAEC